MRPACALVLLSFATACAHGGGRGASARVTCTGLTPELRERMTAADSFTQAQYAAALAQHGLTPIGLPSRQVGGWSEYDLPEGDHGHAPGTSFEEDGKQWLAGPFISVPNGQLPDPYFELAKDAAGDVVRLERAPDIQATSSAVLCGCGPVGSGAAPHVEQVMYELPAGATFRGTVTIAYAARLYSISYSNTDERGERCEPPP